MPLFVFIAPLGLLAIYYAVLIASKPRIPDLGPVVVRYDPPPDLTPAAARYIWKGCVDQRTVACVFAGLATKGRIALEPIKGGYKAVKTTPPANSPALTSDEQSTLEWLFSNFLQEKVFHPQQDSNGCIASLRGFLDRQLRSQYQSARSGWAVLGMLASLVVTMLIASRTADTAGQVLKFAASLFLLCFMTGVITMALLLPAIKDLLKGMASAWRLIFSLAITGFAVAGVVGLSLQLIRFAPAALIGMTCALVAMNIAAVPLLRSVTPKGIEAHRQIEGFREYLLKVQQDQLDRMVAPDSQPPASAEFLSYAIALEVKEAWGDHLVNTCYAG